LSKEILLFSEAFRANCPGGVVRTEC